MGGGGGGWMENFILPRQAVCGAYISYHIYIYAVLGVCSEDFTDSTEEWDVGKLAIDTLDSLMKKTASDSKA